MRSIWKYLFAALFIVLPFIGNAQHLPIVRPEKVGMDSQRLLRADSAIEDAIKKGNIPGRLFPRREELKIKQSDIKGLSLSGKVVDRKSVV